MRDRKPPLVHGGLSCIAGPGNPPEGPSAMVFPAKLCAPGAHALSVAKEEARRTRADQSLLSPSASAASGSIFRVKQCAGHYGRVVTLPDTITGNLRMGNADSTDLAHSWPLNSALMSCNIDG
jgi:hypothetical protein